MTRFNQETSISSDIAVDPVEQKSATQKPVCAVALNQASYPTITEITAKLRKLFPQLEPAQDPVEDEVGIGFVLEGAWVLIIHKPGAVPLTAEDEQTVRKPLSAAILDSQQAHLVVAVIERDRVLAALAATRVAAAIIECCPHAIAVYWPAARQWIASRRFVDEALTQMRSGPPLNLWLDIRVWPVGNKQHAALTRGLAGLGLKEFEVRASPESARELRQRLERLCSYVLVRGPVIQDGHTIGDDADERIAILRCRSAHGLQDTVLRLDYGEDFKPKRPWWKLI